MEYRTLEIKVISAKDIKKVNLIAKMDVYVVVSIFGGQKKTKQKTNVDRDGDTNPAWNFPMNFTVEESAAQQNRLTLVFKLRCERSLGDKDIGEVHVPVKELLDNAGGSKPVQFVSYQVRKPSGKPKGEFTFSYKFSEKIAAGGAVAVAAKADEPVTAYPAAPPVGPSSAHPPPQFPPYVAAGNGPHPPPGGGYPPAPPYPPPTGGGGGYPTVAPPGPGGYPTVAPPGPGGYPAGYGYPPQPYGGGYPPQPPPPGYGYPPQPGYGYPPVQQPPKKNKFGLGLGAGLLGGALGGLLIGDMISDASSYDAGCDAGFGDAGF